MTTLCQGSANPIRVEATLPADEILGHSPVLRQLLDELAVLAQTELPVLLLGETGVGKELFARRLHRQSRRCRKRWPRASYSAMSKVRSPAPATTVPGVSMRPMAARCFLTRWGNCR